MTLILGSASTVLAQADQSPGTPATAAGDSTAPAVAQLKVLLARTNTNAVHAGSVVDMTADVSASGAT